MSLFRLVAHRLVSDSTEELIAIVNSLRENCNPPEELKAQRPILWEVFRQLDDRLTRYNPLVLKLFPDAAARPRQRELLIEFYRKGKVDEAVRAFKKNYMEVVHQMFDNLKGLGSASEPANKF